MRIVLAVAMYNEIKYGPHVSVQLDDALKLNCFDDIVVLDDGSTDGTWDALTEYSKKYNNIHIFRNENNSILSHGENKFKTLYDKVVTFSPDWIQVRAADVIFSDPALDLYRFQVEKLDDRGIQLICFPYVNLWRSMYWHRVDHVWGKQSRSHSVATLWKYNKKAFWEPKHSKASFHQGVLRPTNLGWGKPAVQSGINTDTVNGKEVVEKRPWPVVKLHLGHTTHDKKVVKFRASMASCEAASKIGLAYGIPAPDKMPPVNQWLRFNGYAGFHEFSMKLEKVPQLWYKEPIPDAPKPIPESFYEVIKEFNPQRAEEYKKLFTEKFNVK